MFTPAGSGKMRVTHEIYEQITYLHGVCHTVNIPPGYTFDGATIPRLAWIFIGAPFDPDFCLAACCHDWYCDESLKSKDYQARVIGDAVFFALLAKAGVPQWKRTAMYLAVRLNSWWRYGRVSR
jgi:hypothetical protein